MKFKHTVDGKTAVIEVEETDKKQVLQELKSNKYVRDKNCEFFLLRPMVAKKLEMASKFLPKGHKFKIFETYRTSEKQFALWDEMLQKIEAENPTLSKSEKEEKANQGIANPNGLGSGHQTGGAIDLTITMDDKELDMGTKYLDTTNPKTPMFAKCLTDEQIKNRALLYFLMSVAGFVNYSPEWWHFSYGEHEWAVITNNKKTLFAKIEQHVREG